MQAAGLPVGVIIRSDTVFNTINSELAVGCAISESAYKASEEGALLDIVLEIVEAKHYIAELAIAVRHMEFSDYATIGEYLRGNTIRIGQREDIYRRTILQLAVISFCYTCHVVSPQIEFLKIANRKNTLSVAV